MMWIFFLEKFMNVLSVARNNFIGIESILPIIYEEIKPYITRAIICYNLGYLMGFAAVGKVYAIKKTSSVAIGMLAGAIAGAGIGLCLSNTSLKEGGIYICAATCGFIRAVMIKRIQKKSPLEDATEKFIEQSQMMMDDLKEVKRLMKEDGKRLLQHSKNVIAYNKAVEQRKATTYSCSIDLQNLKTEEKNADVPILRERENTVHIASIISELCTSYPQATEEDFQDLKTIHRVMNEIEEHHTKVKKAVELYLSQSEIFVRLNSPQMTSEGKPLILNQKVHSRISGL